MDDQFRPFIERFDHHIESDERRFDLMSQALNRISASFETQTAATAAAAAQRDKMFNSWWTRVAALGAVGAPFVALGIAIWK